MNVETCLLLDDLARNAVEEDRLECQFIEALTAMSAEERAELPEYLHDVMMEMAPTIQVSYRRVREFVQHRIKLADAAPAIESEFDALMRKLRVMLR